MFPTGGAGGVAEVDAAVGALGLEGGGGVPNIGGGGAPYPTYTQVIKISKKVTVRQKKSFNFTSTTTIANTPSHSS